MNFPIIEAFFYGSMVVIDIDQYHYLLSILSIDEITHQIFESLFESEFFTERAVF